MYVTTTCQFIYVSKETVSVLADMNLILIYFQTYGINELHFLFLHCC